MDWYVLTSPFKQEEKVIEKIEKAFKKKDLKAVFWMPTILMKRREGGRLISSREKMFPGYIFMGLNQPKNIESYFETIRHCNPYLKVLKTTKGHGKKSRLDYATLTDADVDRVRRQENYSLEPMKKAYTEGSRIKFTGGLFNGYIGQISENKDETVLVEIYFVYANIKIEASIHDVEIIESEASVR